MKIIIDRVLSFILKVLIGILKFINWLYVSFPKTALFGLIVGLFISIYNNGQKIQQLRESSLEDQKRIESLHGIIREQTEDIIQLQEQIDSYERRSYKQISFNTNKLVDEYTTEYHLNKKLVECMIVEESSGNPLAVSSSGTYVGLAQYSLSTFFSHRKQLGLPQEDLRTDPNATVQALTSALARGESSHWPNTYKSCIL
jgi:hypothetical protein